MHYIRPDRWRDQPTEPVELDRSHPLGRDCLIAMIFNRHHWGVNLAGGGNLRAIGTPRPKAVPGGTGLDQTYSGDNGFGLSAMPKHWEVSASTPGSRGQTASARIHTVGTPTGNNVTINQHSKGAGLAAPWVAGINLEVSSNATPDASLISYSTQYLDGFYREEYSGWRNPGRTEVFSYSMEYAVFGRYAVDARVGQTANIFVNSGFITYAATNAFKIGQGTNGTANIVTLDFLFWRRPLTAAELRWRAEEPYAMFRPVMRRQYYWPAGGGATVISLACGAWPWAGRVPNVNARTNLLVPPGQFAWTGRAGSVNAQTRLPLAAGQWTWAGRAVTANERTRIQVPPAQIPWAGRTVTIVQPGNITLAPGQYPWSGRPLNVNARTIIAGNRGQWTWSGRLIVDPGLPPPTVTARFGDKLALKLGISRR